MQVYFIDNEVFSKDVHLNDLGKFMQNNDERMMFLGVIETVKKLGWAPDIYIAMVVLSSCHLIHKKHTIRPYDA